MAFSCQRRQLSRNPLVHILQGLTAQTPPPHRQRFRLKGVKIKTQPNVHHLLDMTSNVSVLLFAVLAFRRSAQRHGAAVGRYEEGDPPGGHGGESGEGAQAQGEAASLWEDPADPPPPLLDARGTLNFSVRRIKRSQPWRRKCSLRLTQVNVHRRLMVDSGLEMK